MKRRAVCLLGRYAWVVAWNAAAVAVIVLDDVVTRLERITRV